MLVSRNVMVYFCKILFSKMLHFFLPLGFCLCNARGTFVQNYIRQWWRTEKSFIPLFASVTDQWQRCLSWLMTVAEVEEAFGCFVGLCSILRHEVLARLYWSPYCFRLFARGIVSLLMVFFQLWEKLCAGSFVLFFSFSPLFCFVETEQEHFIQIVL